MDEFWELVKNSQEDYLPLLRESLTGLNENEWFHFDGAALLRSLSQSLDDSKIVAKSICKCRLVDVNKTHFFWLVLALTNEGVNTVPLITKILEEPEYRVIVPQHALILGGEQAAIQCSLLLEEEYVPLLRAELKSHPNPGVKKTLIRMIALDVSEKGQEAIKKFLEENEDSELTTFVKRYSKQKSKDNLPAIDISIKHENLNAFLTAFESRDYQSIGFTN
ncbi:MAG: hypothetical protein O3C20_20095 [Verrucomicrobia bacterium]|nr:hypothetical protein [Verrucomicrobiota bacterium]